MLNAYYVLTMFLWLSYFLIYFLIPPTTLQEADLKNIIEWYK